MLSLETQPTSPAGDRRRTNRNQLVSVVMPVYNGGDSLREAIDSALAQRDVAVEIVAVDDGSTDDSSSILESYGDRIRHIRQENAGPAVARNRALQEATGDWIAFLDCDDVWETNKLSEQLSAADEQSADVVYTSARNFGDVDRVDEVRNGPEQLPCGDVFDQLLQDNFLTMSSVMVLKEQIQSIDGFVPDQTGVEDWGVWLQLAAKGAKFAAVSEPLIRYRWHAASLSKQHEMIHQRRLQVVATALKTARGRQISWARRQQAIANVYRTSAWFVAENSAIKAAAWYAMSLLNWPQSMASWRGLVKACLGRS